MKQETKIKPQLSPIWQFTDPAQYLRAYYEFHKLGTPGFSYGQWAEEMGLKSRSFLRLVLMGKRNLTLETAEMILKGLNLNALEKQYFTNLVRLSRASTLEEKEIPTRELTKLRQKFALKTHNILEIQKNDLFDFLSSYKIPRLQVLLNLDGLEKTEENLSRIMNTKLSEITRLLEILDRMKLAKRLENGEWLAQKSKLMTPDVLGHVALQSFHKKSLEESIQAIDLPPDTRRYQSLVMALTPEEFQDLHHEIRQHLELLLKKFESKKTNNKKVYQMNINLIPVTGSIFRDERVPMESPETSEVKNENK